MIEVSFQPFLGEGDGVVVNMRGFFHLRVIYAGADKCRYMNGRI